MLNNLPAISSRNLLQEKFYWKTNNGNLIYSGGWQNGKRQGHGTAFDKNGNVVYTGEWKDDRYENGILYRHVQNEDKA